ncbi:hypothetical protein EG835_02990 [bacterium]|nr:hypothetical protein [bacterium]
MVNAGTVFLSGLHGSNRLLSRGDHLGLDRGTPGEILDPVLRNRLPSGRLPAVSFPEGDDPVGADPHFRVVRIEQVGLPQGLERRFDRATLDQRECHRHQAADPLVPIHRLICLGLHAVGEARAHRRGEIPERPV